MSHTAAIHHHRRREVREKSQKKRENKSLKMKFNKSVIVPMKKVHKLWVTNSLRYSNNTPQVKIISYSDFYRKRKSLRRAYYEKIPVN